MADQSLIRPVRAKPRSAPMKAPVYLYKVMESEYVRTT